MKRKILWVVSMALLLACAALSAETVTLPAAASIVGGAPFFSDARAFNTSYTASLTVTATYRCFIPSPCTAVLTPVVDFTLGPRESRAFDDMVADTFGAPDTAGGVEFDHSGSSGQLVVTSRLFSTEPQATVGMFIPGLDSSEADPVTVLTSIRNRGPDAGFRTNVGVFNPEDSAVTVTFSIFDANGAAVGVPVVRPVGGHSGLQVSRIFDVALAPDFVTDNAVIVVSATGEVFSYAAVIDNATTDPIFVVGAQDQPPQPITPGASATPTNTPPGPTATRTPTQPGPTATPTPTPPAGGSRTVNVGGGSGGMNFIDQVTGTNTSTITVGTTITWVWVGTLFHSTTSISAEPWDSGVFEAPHEFSHTFNTPGTFDYICTEHNPDMTGTVIVSP
jgi:plastocyanin